MKKISIICVKSLCDIQFTFFFSFNHDVRYIDLIPNPCNQMSGFLKTLKMLQECPNKKNISSELFISRVMC